MTHESCVMIRMKSYVKTANFFSILLLIFSHLFLFLFYGSPPSSDHIGPSSGTKMWPWPESRYKKFASRVSVWQSPVELGLFRVGEPSSITDPRQVFKLYQHDLDWIWSRSGHVSTLLNGIKALVLILGKTYMQLEIVVGKIEKFGCFQLEWNPNKKFPTKLSTTSRLIQVSGNT